jgi:hypothetical protein
MWSDCSQNCPGELGGEAEALAAAVTGADVAAFPCAGPTLARTDPPTALPAPASLLLALVQPANMRPAPAMIKTATVRMIMLLLRSANLRSLLGQPNRPRGCDKP